MYMVKVFLYEKEQNKPTKPTEQKILPRLLQIRENNRIIYSFLHSKYDSTSGYIVLIYMYLPPTQKPLLGLYVFMTSRVESGNSSIGGL